MKKIFILNGSGGKGKDTFAEKCAQYRKVRHESAIAPSKDALTHLVGYEWGDEKQEGELGEKFRALLSDVKLLSIEFNDYPYQYIASKIIEFTRSEDEILFIDIREPEEIEKIKNIFVCKTILVRNGGVKDITSNPADGNVEKFEYDIVIDNSGSLDDLGKMAENFITEHVNR